MAYRRIFAKSEVRTPEFLMMSKSAQLLYYNLNMEADDEGFVQAWLVMKDTDSTVEDYEELENNGYLQKFNDNFLTLILSWCGKQKVLGGKITESSYHDLLENPIKPLPKKNLDSSREKNEQPKLIQVNSIQVNSTQDNKTKHEDASSLFEKYFKLFRDFTRKNQSKRAMAVKEFLTLLPAQRTDAIRGAENYISWFTQTGENPQYSTNAYEFLKNQVFSEYQKIPDIPKKPGQTGKTVNPVPSWTKETTSRPLTDTELEDFERFRAEALKEM